MQISGTAPIRIALIGTGAMGSLHARVVMNADVADLVVVIDPLLQRAQALADLYGTQASSDVEDALDCDAAIIASSTDSHSDLALYMLENDRPLLIEKPLATTFHAVEQVVRVSERRGVPIVCGFVERFNPVITTLHAMLDEPVVHLSTTRHSPPNPRSSASVVLDLLIHDIDLALRLVGGNRLPSVSAAAVRHGDLAEIADCLLHFQDGALASLSASRAAQRKVRDLRLGTATSLYELDLLRSTITVYQHISHEMAPPRRAGYRAETVVDIPFVRHQGEPLALQFEHFLKLASGRLDADEERASLLLPHRVAELIALEIDIPTVRQP